MKFLLVQHLPGASTYSSFVQTELYPVVSLFSLLKGANGEKDMSRIFKNLRRLQIYNINICSDHLNARTSQKHSTQTIDQFPT